MASGIGRCSIAGQDTDDQRAPRDQVDRAVLAWPTRPGETGKSTFIMSEAGVTHEREFGDQTLEAVRQITAFDPDDNWKEVEDDD